MSVEIIAPSSAASARPNRISIPKIEPALDRRQRARRAEDRAQLTLVELTRWFIERETQPHIVVDQQMNILVMNESAKSYSLKSTLLAVSSRKLSFANARHRELVNRFLRKGAAEDVLTVRGEGSPTSFCLKRLPVLEQSASMLLITVSFASGVDAERVQTQFGLTRAELEVALSIFKGLSLVKIAKARDASINTVKTQTRYVFQKCRVNSQVALTRRIGEIK